jgi:hypothetical protein
MARRRSSGPERAYPTPMTIFAICGVGQAPKDTYTSFFFLAALHIFNLFIQRRFLWFF